MSDPNDVLVRLLMLGSLLTQAGRKEPADIAAAAFAEIERVRDRVKSLEMVVAGNRARRIGQRRRKGVAE